MPRLKIGIKKNPNGPFYKKANQLIKADKDSVDIGHFQSQGLHSEYGVSYVEMMRIHHFGDQIDGKNVPERPVLTHLNARASQVLSDRSTKTDAKRWLTKDLNSESFLASIGRRLAIVEKLIFGSSPPLLQNTVVTAALKGGNTPLVDTEELRDKVSYRTSVSKKIIE